MSSHALLPRIATALSWTVFVASAPLVALLSVDAFTPGLGTRLEGGLYNRLQLPVCILYLLYFFVSMAASGQAGAYMRTHFPMLLISIPYVWLLGLFDIHTQGAVAYVLHFMPSFRAALALTLVTRFISMSRLTGLFVSYAIILALAIYFSSIIFYLHEGGGVNPAVTDYPTALWWCLMQATTLGASFYAVTVQGKAVAMVVSVMGMVMLPLFTVLLTQAIRKTVTVKNNKNQKNSTAG